MSDWCSVPTMVLTGFSLALGHGFGCWHPADLKLHCLLPLLVVGLPEGYCAGLSAPGSPESVVTRPASAAPGTQWKCKFSVISRPPDGKLLGGPHSLGCASVQLILGTPDFTAECREAWNLGSAGRGTTSQEGSAEAAGCSNKRLEAWAWYEGCGWVQGPHEGDGLPLVGEVGRAGSAVLGPSGNP